MNPLDQRGTAESPVSLVPQISVPFLEHQTDATEIVSCVDQDSVLATVCNSVSRAGFSGKRVLESWPILFGSVDVSEPFGCCTDSGDFGTIRQPSQASNAKRCNSCGNHSPEVAAAALLCMCPETSASSDAVERAEPDNPSEAVGLFGRIVGYSVQASCHVVGKLGFAKLCQPATRPQLSSRCKGSIDSTTRYGVSLNSLG